MEPSRAPPRCVDRARPHRQVWHSSVPALGVKASGGSVRGESCSFTPAPGNPAVHDRHVERKVQLTLNPASRWRLSYHYRWLYWKLYTRSCPLPLPPLRTSTSHRARQPFIRLSVACGLGTTLLQMPFQASLYLWCHGVDLPPASAPSLSSAPHPAPLLAPQHKGKVNHDPVPALTQGDRIPETHAMSGEIPGDADTQ